MIIEVKGFLSDFKYFEINRKILNIENCIKIIEVFFVKGKIF